MDIDDAQRALEAWARGRPGFNGAGRAGAPGRQHLVLYVGPAWNVPATELPDLGGIRVEVRRLTGGVRPL